jgi:hypothetical protein
MWPKSLKNSIPKVHRYVTLFTNRYTREKGQETANGRQWTLIEEKSASICSSDWRLFTFNRGYSMMGMNPNELLLKEEVFQIVGAAIEV